VSGDLGCEYEGRGVNLYQERHPYGNAAGPKGMLKATDDAYNLRFRQNGGVIYPICRQGLTTAIFQKVVLEEIRNKAIPSGGTVLLSIGGIL
jgi:hypothetical protein